MAQNFGSQLSGNLQGVRTNHTPMDIEATSPGITAHHNTNMSPSPGLGNLQSVVSTNNSSHISNTLSQSPLTTALQGGNIINNAPSSLNLGAQTKSLPITTVSSSSHDSITQILTRPRLHDLVREVDPTEQLDEEVEELLLQLADDFVETTVDAACKIAKHRRTATIDIKDIQLHLERNWNMWIPGFGTDELRPYKRSSVTEAHKQRLALIRKALKKY